MKTHARLVTFAAALTAALASPAQIFTEDALAGATLGAIAGGIIGNNSRHSNTWEGAAIGAGAGLILGSIVGEARRDSAWSDTQVPRPSRGWHHGYPDHRYYPWPQSPIRDWRPSAATQGALLGAVAGGIIGNNSRHSNTWEGVAIGAGSGFLLGSILDESRRGDPHAVRYPARSSNGWHDRYGPPQHVWRDDRRHDTSWRGAPAPRSGLFGPGGSLPPAGDTIIINNYYFNSTPMAPANALFGR